jgi:hypothetical protein
MEILPARRILFPFRGQSTTMDFLLIFSILILAFLLLSMLLVVKRMQTAPGTPLGRGMGLALGLAVGLALWLPMEYITGNQSTGIILGSTIGIGLGVTLELWSRKRVKTIPGP